MFGVLAVNKPAGLTSRDVVNRVQHLVKPHKVGHTGTLDPSATGVLLLAIGRATRLVEFAHALPKEYRAQFRFGLTSDTLDADSPSREVVGAAIPTAHDLAREIDNWVGEIHQVPPRYSAVHVGGRRAYELARQGEEFDIPGRTALIYALKVVGYDYPELELSIRCGSGTYIRSLGSDLARALGTDAIMTHLVRTRIGAFTLPDCSQLDALCDTAAIAAGLWPACWLVNHLPAVTLNSVQSAAIRNGIPLELTCMQQQVAALDTAGELVAILAETTSGSYRSRRVFQIDSDVAQPSSNRTPHSPES